MLRPVEFTEDQWTDIHAALRYYRDHALTMGSPRRLAVQVILSTLDATAEAAQPTRWLSPDELEAVRRD